MSALAGVFDVVIAGAGPSGIAGAVHAQRAGLRIAVTALPLNQSSWAGPPAG